MISRNPKAGSGFSLVEVVLAVGIVAFCLLAILGLSTVGQSASSRASDETSLAAAALQTASRARMETNLFTPYTCYFDRRGQSVTNLNEASYVCEVSYVTVPATEMRDISTNLRRMKMQFSWPASVAVNRPFTNTFYAALSQP